MLVCRQNLKTVIKRSNFYMVTEKYLYLILLHTKLTCLNFVDDHNRVLLKETASATGSDYINASYIVSIFCSLSVQSGAFIIGQYRSFATV